MIPTSGHMLFFGCSYTSGFGLPDQTTQNYTYLLSQRLNKNAVNFASPGLNNYTSFDFASKIQLQEKNVSIVFQVTELSRIRYYDKKTCTITDRILSQNPDRTLMEVYCDEFLIYELDRHLRFLTNYTRLAGANLIIWSIARSFDNEINKMIEDCLSQFKEYVYLDNRLNSPDSYRVDNGTDGTKELGTGHPGPKSHELIAEKLFSHYKKLYQI